MFLLYSPAGLDFMIAWMRAHASIALVFSPNPTGNLPIDQSFGLLDGMG